MTAVGVCSKGGARGDARAAQKHGKGLAIGSAVGVGVNTPASASASPSILRRPRLALEIIDATSLSFAADVGRPRRDPRNGTGPRSGGASLDIRSIIIFSQATARVCTLLRLNRSSSN